MKYLNRFLISAVILAFSSLCAQQTANIKLLETSPEWCATSYWGGAKVCKEGSFCFLSGLQSAKDNNAWGKKVVTLPADFKPTKHLVFCTCNSDGPEGYSQIDVLPNGDVSWAALGKQNWVTLNDIYFSVVEGTQLPLKTGCTSFGEDQGNVTVKKEGNIVMISGSVKCTLTADDKGIVLAELPADSRPISTLVFKCIYNDGAAKKGDIVITKDGLVTLKVAKGIKPAWVSLSNVLFSTANGTPLKLSDGITNLPGEYAPATYQKIGTKIGLLQGSMGGVFANGKAIASFPYAEIPAYANSIASGASDVTNAGRIDVYSGWLSIYGGAYANAKALHVSGVAFPICSEADVNAQNIGIGSASFVYVGGSDLVAHESWKIGVPGSGWVKFKANAERDLYFALTTLPNSLNGPCQGAGYIFRIGENWNKTSSIYKYSNYNWVFADPETRKNIKLKELNVNKGDNPNGIIVPGKFEDYWVQIDKDFVAWGKGTEVGKNEMQRLSETLPFAQYVCFGACPGVKAEFKDIQFSPIPVVEIPVNLPADFEAENVKFKNISVGSYNNDLDVWSIELNKEDPNKPGELKNYVKYSLADDPWIKKEFKDASGNVMKFEDISCASDGTVAAICDGKALIYDRTANKWGPLNPGAEHADLDLEFISAGSKDNIWGVDFDEQDIYQWTPDGWVLRADGFGSFVAAGVDGTVVALSTAGKPHFFDKGRWIEIPGPKFEKVAAANKYHVIGSTHDNALFELKDGKFVAMLGVDGKPATGLDEISINAAGTIFALDEDGDQYNKGEAGITLTIPARVEIINKVIGEIIKKDPKIDKNVAKLEAMKKVTKTAPAKKTVAKETRKEAKAAGKVKKTAVKAKTTGKGKAAKKISKVKAKTEKAKKPEVAKKAKAKADKKAAKKKQTTVKESAQTQTTAKAAQTKSPKTVKQVKPKATAKKATTAKKTAVKKPAAKKPVESKKEEEKTPVAATAQVQAQ